MKVAKLGPGLDLVELLLKNLDFADNFKGSSQSLDIDAGEEIAIVNPFGFIPSRFLLLDVQLRSAGTVSITRGTAADWSSSRLTLKNSGTAGATITVVFLP